METLIVAMEAKMCRASRKEITTYFPIVSGHWKTIDSDEPPENYWKSWVTRKKSVVYTSQKSAGSSHNANQWACSLEIH